jgi:hypothetical protein
VAIGAVFPPCGRHMTELQALQPAAEVNAGPVKLG